MSPMSGPSNFAHDLAVHGDAGGLVVAPAPREEAVDDLSNVSGV
jgi:hypothetical protein